MSLCESIDTLAMAYLDGELATAERHELETHLTECASCKSELDDARADQDLIIGSLASPPRASDSMRMRLGVTFDKVDRDAVRDERRRRQAWILPGGAILAAAAAIAMFVGVGSSHSKVTNVAKASAGRPRNVEVASTGGWADQAQRVFADELASPVDMPGSRLTEQQQVIVNGHSGFELKFDVTVKARHAVLKVLELDDVDVDRWSQGEEVKAADRTMHLIKRVDATMVSYVDAAHHGWVFSSTELSTEELVALVGRTALVGPQ